MYEAVLAVTREVAQRTGVRARFFSWFALWAEHRVAHGRQFATQRRSGAAAQPGLAAGAQPRLVALRHDHLSGWLFAGRPLGCSGRRAALPLARLPGPGAIHIDDARRGVCAAGACPQAGAERAGPLPTAGTTVAVAVASVFRRPHLGCELHVRVYGAAPGDRATHGAGSGTLRPPPRTCCCWD